MTNRIIEAMDFESDTQNFKYPFKVMTSKYGREFIDYIKAAWEANGDSQTEEQFCTMNGIPKTFFDKIVIK